MALLYAAHYAGWSLRMCRSLKGAGACPCLQIEAEGGKRARTDVSGCTFGKCGRNWRQSDDTVVFLIEFM